MTQFPPKNTIHPANPQTSVPRFEKPQTGIRFICRMTQRARDILIFAKWGRRRPPIAMGVTDVHRLSDSRCSSRWFRGIPRLHFSSDRSSVSTFQKPFLQYVQNLYRYYRIYFFNNLCIFIDCPLQLIISFTKNFDIIKIEPHFRTYYYMESIRIIIRFVCTDALLKKVVVLKRSCAHEGRIFHTHT